MQNYDVVIIGSGLGGLVSGYILSKEGFSTCILEKNENLGGCLQTFVRDGCSFDVGGHYAGGLEHGQNLNRYFKYLGIIDNLKLKKLDEAGFDTIGFGDDPQKEYKIPMGEENFIESLSSHFPGELENLKYYIKKINEIKSDFPLFNIRIDESSLDEVSQYSESIGYFLNSVTKNKKLRNVLAGQNFLYAGIPNRTPLYIHSLITGSFIESAWKFIGGCSQITNLIADKIRENGGVILPDSCVTKLNFNGNEISDAELTDGSKITGKKFISNIHPSLTLDMIEKSKIKKSYRDRISNLDNTASVFSLYIVFKPGSFRYLNTNYYFYRSNYVWVAENCKGDTPINFFLITPADSYSQEYAESATVLSYMDFETVKKWENSFVGGRCREYDNFKTFYAEKLLDLVEMKFPGFRNSVQSYFTATPLTYKNTTGTKNGSMYGVLKDCNEPLKTLILPRTKIPNLFLTGQNIKIHGILGTTIGAVLTCGEIIGLEYLVNKIKSAS